MPVEIIKYLCQFKCGTKAKSTISQIKLHEATCFKNPEYKTCSTCKNEVYEKDVIEVFDPYYMRSETMVRSCKKLSSERFEALVALSDYHTQPKFHKQPVRKCPYWEGNKLNKEQKHERSVATESASNSKVD